MRSYIDGTLQTTAAIDGDPAVSANWTCEFTIIRDSATLLAQYVEFRYKRSDASELWGITNLGNEAVSDLAANAFDIEMTGQDAASAGRAVQNAMTVTFIPI